MAESHFAIAYDGPALATGRMPVRDLAPALLALGELFAESAQVLYPDSGSVSLSIEATTTGSFDVRLILEAADLWDQIVDVFSSDHVTALVNLKTIIVGGTGFGLFEVLRHIGSRRIKKEEHTSAGLGYLRVILDDGTAIEMSPDVAKLVRRFSIRRKARDVVSPLGREGIDEVRLSRDSARPPDVVITKGELDAYEGAATEEGEVLLDEEREMLFQLSSVSFEGDKWRLSDGTQTFGVSVEDTTFIDEVSRGELFGKGDMLRCRMRVIQSRRPEGGLRTEYHVVQVIAHLPRAQQLELDDTI